MSEPTTPPGDDRPLLPGLTGNAALQRQLRLSLETLRDQADPRVRERLTAVLEGRASLRDVAREDGFSRFVGPLADRGWDRFREMSPQERDEARRLVEEGEDPDGTAEGAPRGTPPSHDGGTW
ncbi:hypothetical protein KC207_03930 [Phycicoccus sp. BSK3Z-2]|uniref:Uncharacterized protein n=1 Tax=Phycicoccus avicenniae TaxID=2828860 RepID=A0A941D9P7_9MICO|nr:hypothetical protein [Phycicoccus avicenniae]MBR7742437.1 hypothetical protein [Phycicoccus avicenniae]